MFNNSGYSLSDIAAVTEKDGLGFGGNSIWIILLFLVLFGGGSMLGFGRNNAAFQGATTREEVAYGFDMNNLENGIRGIQNGLCDGFYSLNTNLLTGFNSLQNSTNQGFAGLNTVINTSTSQLQQDLNALNIANMQNTNAITSQLNSLGAQQADCCCQTQRALERGFADLGYNLATQECQTRQTITDNARDIIENQNNGVRSILDFLTQDKIATLQAENQALKFTASQTAQNEYLVSQLRPCPVPAYITCNPWGGASYGACNTTAYC